MNLNPKTWREMVGDDYDQNSLPPNLNLNHIQLAAMIQSNALFTYIGWIRGMWRTKMFDHFDVRLMAPIVDAWLEGVERLVLFMKPQTRLGFEPRKSEFDAMLQLSIHGTIPIDRLRLVELYAGVLNCVQFMGGPLCVRLWSEKTLTVKKLTDTLTDSLFPAAFSQLIGLASDIATRSQQLSSNLPACPHRLARQYPMPELPSGQRYVSIDGFTQFENKNDLPPNVPLSSAHSPYISPKWNV